MIYYRQSPPVSTFVARGFPEREWFSHSAVAIDKQYPDTFLLLEGRGVPRVELGAGEFVQINLYSDELSGLPAELFTDPQINWHNQQLGRQGLIAAAGLYLHADALTITVMQSDLCQQLYRDPDFKGCRTQIEKRFGRWYRFLFNAILDFATECSAASVRCPTARSILGFTAKPIRPDLFERIYDWPGRHYASRRVMHGRAEYWEVALADNQTRVIALRPAAPATPAETGTSICIFHDIEEDVDTTVSPQECRRSLTAMLAIERHLGIAASYNILGTLFLDKRDEIRASSSDHALAFHSFNHNGEDQSQLAQCRDVDLQVRGYRPPRSVLTSELTDFQLSYFNFEWLACGTTCVRTTSCILQNGIVKIPIVTDDYPLATGQVGYAEWESGLLESSRNATFFAFGLHDCYAATWLDEYPKLLERLLSVGTFVTADQVSDRLFWRSGTELPVRRWPAGRS